MENLPDKFELDLYLKTFLYKIIERKKPLPDEPISSKSKSYFREWVGNS